MALRRFTLFSMALVSISSFPLPKAAADSLSSWVGGSGNWSTAGQWTPAVVPNNTASQAYDVTIGSGTATLDVNPTINTLTLNGNLAQGYTLSNGQYTTLTVNGNATVTGAIAGPNPSVGTLDSLSVGGNLTNSGGLSMGASFSVGGNFNNSGTVMLLYDGSLMSGFSVGGRLVNTGTLNWGTTDGVNPGPPSFLGPIVNQGSIFIGPGTNVTGGAVTDIPKGAAWTVGGSFSGFAALTGIEGTLTLQSASTLGSAGSTINNTGSVSVNSAFGPAPITVAGNFSNAGGVTVGAQPTPPLRPDGASSFSVAGSFVNQANGTLNINNPSFAITPSSGSFDAGKLVNYGTATFQAGTTSSAQQVENYGTLSIFGDAAGDVGELTTGTLKLGGGVVTVYNNGGTLIVGTGAASGVTGYDQLANGVLEAAGGALTVQGSASLNGTLDILLGEGAKPIGTMFYVLSAAAPGQLTGIFADVEGLVFDGGRERYALDYNYAAGDVTLTVEQNTTPEPGSVFLMMLGLSAILATFRRKQTPRSAPPPAI